MVKYCTAIGCKSNSKIRPSLSFHQFPKDKNTSQLWSEHMQMGKWRPDKCSRLCSLHFTNDSYYSSKSNILKPSAVPTVFKYTPGKPPLLMRTTKKVDCESRLREEIVVEEIDKQFKSSILTPAKKQLGTGNIADIKIKTAVEDQSSDMSLNLKPEEFLMYCRVCAEPARQPMAIFGDVGKKYQLASAIQKHLRLKISENDALPLVACRHCTTTLIAFDKIYSNSSRAERKLWSVLRKITKVARKKPQKPHQLLNLENETVDEDMPEPELSVLPVDDDFTDVTHNLKPLHEIGALDVQPVEEDKEDSMDLPTESGIVTPSKLYSSLKIVPSKDKLDYGKSQIHCSRKETLGLKNGWQEVDQVSMCRNCELLIANVAIEEHIRLCAADQQMSKKLDNSEPMSAPRKRKKWNIDTKDLAVLLNLECADSKSMAGKENTTVTKTPVLKRLAAKPEKPTPTPTMRKKVEVFDTYTIIQGRYVCNSCLNEFQSEPDVLHHIECDHTNKANQNNEVKPYKATCEHCGEVFHGKGSFNGHIRNCSSQPRSPLITCQECKEMFLDIAFPVHVTKSHPKKFFCLVCGCSFFFNAGLKEHRARMHLN